MIMISNPYEYSDYALCISLFSDVRSKAILTNTYMYGLLDTRYEIIIGNSVINKLRTTWKVR